MIGKDKTLSKGTFSSGRTDQSARVGFNLWGQDPFTIDWSLNRQRLALGPTQMQTYQWMSEFTEGMALYQSKALLEEQVIAIINMKYRTSHETSLALNFSWLDWKVTIRSNLMDQSPISLFELFLTFRRPKRMTIRQ